MGIFLFLSRQVAPTRALDRPHPPLPLNSTVLSSYLGVSFEYATRRLGGGSIRAIRPIRIIRDKEIAYNLSMPILKDPERNEIKVLFDLYNNWEGKSVLEIGSGDGRLTWRYADKVSRVVALEPEEKAHATALKNRPDEMGRVELSNLGFDEFARQNKEKFDLAVLAWSL